MYCTYEKPNKIAYRFHPSFRPWPNWRDREEHSGEESQVDFIPRVNVTSDKEGYLVHVELPGMKKDEIKIGLTEHILTISGERKIEHGDDTVWIHRERTAGKFERSILFKKEVDGSKISAAYEEGVLKIAVPYAEHVKPTNIRIN